MFILLAALSSVGHCYHKKLLDKLLSNYSKIIRPVVNHTDYTKVMIQFSLSKLRQLNPRFQVLTVSAWLHLKWKDDYLKWNPAHYGGQSELRLLSSKIWRPDIVLSNSVDEDRTAVEVLSDTRASIKHDGTVSWSIPALFQSSCRIEVSSYPYDTQRCALIFGPWSHSSKEVKLQQAHALAHLEEYEKKPSGVWRLIGVKSKDYKKMVGEKQPKEYNYVAYYVIMQRRASFYVFHLVLPITSLMVIGIFVFIVPPESGEKVSLASTVLLSMIIFIEVLIKNIPPTSEYTSLFAKFIGGVILLLSCATYMSVLVSFVHYQGVHGKRPPVWLKKLVLYHGARVMCMGDDHYVLRCYYFVKSKLLSSKFAYADDEFDDIPVLPLPLSIPSNLSARRPNRNISYNNVGDSNSASYGRGVSGSTGDTTTGPRAFNITESNFTREMLIDDMIHVLIDILEELRLIRSSKSEDRLVETTQELVTAEWRDLALVIDRACLIIYTSVNIVFTISIYNMNPGYQSISDISIPHRL
ncbi:Neuronal acetylcholine receptor subunit alpha-10 [Lamellibrachia satsuma]|nr:Neuronal acetylcholine receptor subunit alpha-10 [Lamellibrachia satsuma]